VRINARVLRSSFDDARLDQASLVIHDRELPRDCGVARQIHSNRSDRFVRRACGTDDRRGSIDHPYPARNCLAGALTLMLEGSHGRITIIRFEGKRLTWSDIPTQTRTWNNLTNPSPPLI
jgi:hypothetical protein